jgi:hypothetical protein
MTSHRTAYALVAGGTMPNGELEPGQRVARVSARPTDQKIASSMAAAAGIKATLVSVGEHSDLVLISEASSSVAAMPVRLRYNDKILRALLPGADIKIGSLRSLMPEVDWLTDPGGMVVTLPSNSPRAIPVYKTDVPRGPYARSDAPIVLKVDALPKPALGVRGPVRRVALDSMRIRDVPLKENDVVIDHTGDRWFARGGALWSHKSVTLSRDDVIMEGRTLRPSRGGTPLVGVRTGDKIEVLLLNSRNDTVYGVVTDGDPDVWIVRMDVNTSIVSDPRATCFGARLATTAAECYAAGGVWDRPCESDPECPYYDSRSGRGGCVSGTCEMPLGVGNKSFRVADPATPPLCDSDGPDPWCPDDVLSRYGISRSRR